MLITNDNCTLTAVSFLGNVPLWIALLFVLAAIFYIAQYIQRKAKKLADAASTNSISVSVRVLAVEYMDGVAIRAKTPGPTSSVMLFFVDEDDFDAAELAELLILQDGDLLHIDYSVPARNTDSESAGSRQIVLVRNWKITTLACEF